MSSATTVFLTAIAWFAACCAGCESPSPSESASGPDHRMTIGVYDSRSVAVAYGGSELHEAQTARLQAMLGRAREAGDERAIKDCDERVWDARKHLHRQAFGTESVDDLLALVPSEVERITRASGVDLLVSCWDEEKLASYEGAARVDVTEQLIEAFDPSERQRGRALAMREHDPLSAEALERMFRSHGR